MTPNELYVRTPTEVVKDDLSWLKGCYYDHLPEVNADGSELIPIVEGGITSGMRRGIDHARSRLRLIVFREIGVGL